MAIKDENQGGALGQLLGEIQSRNEVTSCRRIGWRWPDCSCGLQVSFHCESHSRGPAEIEIGLGARWDAGNGEDVSNNS